MVGVVTAVVVLAALVVAAVAALGGFPGLGGLRGLGGLPWLGPPSPGPPVLLERAGEEASTVEAVRRSAFRERVGDNVPAEEDERALFYIFEPPLDGDGTSDDGVRPGLPERSEARALYLDVTALPSESQIVFFGQSGKRTRTRVPSEAVPGAVPGASGSEAGRYERVVHPSDAAPIVGMMVLLPEGAADPAAAAATGDRARGEGRRAPEPPGSPGPSEASERPSERSGLSGPLMRLSAGEAFGGFFADGEVLRIADGVEVESAPGPPPAWSVSYSDAAPAGRVELDYRTGRGQAGHAEALVELEGDGGSAAYRLRLDGESGTAAFPVPSLGFTPRRVRVETAAAGFSLRRVQWHRFAARRLSDAAEADELVPIPADLRTVFEEYPRAAWRRDDFEVFAWAAYPRILVFDTADYTVQSRLFKRLAFYVEKRGFRGRLLSNAELAGRHGWNAHNYDPEGLAAFFTAAERDGVELNPEELLLRDILCANDVIRPGAEGFEPGAGGILSISQESPPPLRRLLLTHEAFHGVYYEEPAFRAGVSAVWEGLSEVERSYWRELFSYLSYDPTDENLMINEFQAYLLQQPQAEARGYLRHTLAPRLMAARPDTREEVQRFLAEHPDTFEQSAREADRVLRRHTPFRAGEVMLLDFLWTFGESRSRLEGR